MRERIQALLDNEQMTNKQFADAVGINPAAVSHLLSGRNKPSYDLLCKILESFPSLSAEWLMTGREPMYKEGNAAPVSTPSASAGRELDLFSYSNEPEVTGRVARAEERSSASQESRVSSDKKEVSAASADGSAPAARSEKNAAEAKIAESAPGEYDGTAAQTIIREIVKEAPARKIVRVVAYFDDNTYEDFTSAGRKP